MRFECYPFELLQALGDGSWNRALKSPSSKIPLPVVAIVNLDGRLYLTTRLVASFQLSSFADRIKIARLGQGDDMYVVI